MGFNSQRKPYEIRERAGYIAQQFGLPADLTVHENLQFFADIHNVTRADQRKRIPALLDFAGLSRLSKPAGRKTVGRDEEETGAGLQPGARTPGGAARRTHPGSRSRSAGVSSGIC